MNFQYRISENGQVTRDLGAVVSPNEERKSPEALRAMIQRHEENARMFAEAGERENADTCKFWAEAARKELGRLLDSIRRPVTI